MEGGLEGREGISWRSGKGWEDGGGVGVSIWRYQGRGSEEEEEEEVVEEDSALVDGTTKLLSVD